MTGISAACSRFRGYLGTEFIRPVEPGDPRFVCIFRFDDFENLERWMDSKERAGWLDRVQALCSEEARLDRYRSLEFWFASDKHRRLVPAKRKMAAATFAAIWPLVHFLPPALTPRLPGPRWLAEGTVVLFIVLLMTFAVMPAMTRLLDSWLYKD